MIKFWAKDEPLHYIYIVDILSRGVYLSSVSEDYKGHIDYGDVRIDNLLLLRSYSFD